MLLEDLFVRRTVVMLGEDLLRLVRIEILCLSAGSISGPLLVSFFSITRKQSLWMRKPMTTPATRNVQERPTEGTLFVAFELSENLEARLHHRAWSKAARAHCARTAAGACAFDEIAHAKRRMGLPASAAVVSCYEAGREGFWLHRYFVQWITGGSTVNRGHAHHRSIMCRSAREGRPRCSAVPSETVAHATTAVRASSSNGL